jgi:DNA-binding transcriptional ArsR family regulator
MTKTKPKKATHPGFESTLGAMLSHPTRVAAYVIINEREASPQEIAHQLGLSVTHVGYHVRALHRMGHIELVREKPVRGAIAHFYKAVRPVVGDTEAWEEMSMAERETISRLVLQLITAEAANAVDEGAFDRRPDRCLVRQPIAQMDAEGFAELHDLQEKLMEDTKRVMGDVANRRAADPDLEVFPATAVSMLFQRPDRDPS